VIGGIDRDWGFTRLRGLLRSEEATRSALDIVSSIDTSLFSYTGRSTEYPHKLIRHVIHRARANRRERQTIMTRYPDLQLLINGEWLSRPGEPVINPADESVIGTLPHATEADLAEAAAAAEEGFRVWRRTSPAKRAEIIIKAARLIRERVEELAVTMTLEQGKPIAESRMEILRACDIIEWDAAEGRRVYGRVIPSEPGMRRIVLRQPIGVVAAMSPWNFPVSSPARKVGGALSAGCSIILKASGETPGGAGQICVSPTRFFVHEAIYERFALSFGERAAVLKPGNGLDPATRMGPLANLRRIAAMEAFTADAKAKGARLLSGGSRAAGRGYFFPLTVLADVPDDARAMQEEPFGPLALLSPFHSLEEAIEKANSLPYGLAGYAFTNSARNANRLAEELEVGNLSINHFVASIAETPFGGVKESGYGREGGIEGLECYTVVKNVSHLFERQDR